MNLIQGLKDFSSLYIYTFTGTFSSQKEMMQIALVQMQWICDFTQIYPHSKNDVCILQLDCHQFIHVS